MATKGSKSVKARTMSEVLSVIAEETELSRKQVSSVVNALTTLMKKDLSKIGAFGVTGVFKAIVIQKPATKARKGINPFTKEEVMFKAKPARNVIKVRPLKSLKSMV